MDLPNHLGDQYIIELYGCKKTKLNDLAFIEVALKDAAIAAKATIVQQFFHQYSPHGISGTIVIAESHLNLHTWPEYDFAAVDVFTCGEELRPDLALEVLKSRFEALHCTIEKIKRGKDIRNWVNKNALH